MNDRQKTDPLGVCAVVAHFIMDPAIAYVE
jgi:hypothetical protein